MADNEESLASFMSITGSDPSTALQYLEVTNWNLPEAVNLYMESGGQGLGARSGGDGFSDFPPPAPSGAASAYAYESEDVRAPDPSKRQRLVGESYDSLPVRRLHEQYRDFAAESIAAITAATQAGPISSAFGPSSGGSSTSSTRDLSTLFQPPVNLMFQGTYSEARALAKSQSKWLLVNIQDEAVFASHMLNRDVWSDDIVENVVASDYIFWQHFWASEQGKKFCTLYQIDRETLPLIAIVDPRTGEIAQRWTGFISAQDIIEKLSDFAYSDALGSETTPPTTTERPSRDFADASEEDQLAAAIAASLEDRDEDAYQAESPDEETKTEGVVDEVVITMPPEPADGTPDVTRVQLRTPDGSRLTRRFLKSDPVSLLWTYVKEQIPEARGRSFELRTAFPPAAITFSDSESLQDRQLVNASLMVKWI